MKCNYRIILVTYKYLKFLKILYLAEHSQLFHAVKKIQLKTLQSNLHFLYFCFSVYCNMFTDKKLNLKILFHQQKLRNFHLQEVLFQFWKHPSHLCDFKLWREELLLSNSKQQVTFLFSKGITTVRYPPKNIPLHVLRAKPTLSSFLPHKSIF